MSPLHLTYTFIVLTSTIQLDCTNTIIIIITIIIVLSTFELSLLQTEGNALHYKVNSAQKYIHIKSVTKMYLNQFASTDDPQYTRVRFYHDMHPLIYRVIQKVYILSNLNLRHKYI